MSKLIKVKVLRGFSTYDSTGKILGKDGDIMDLREATVKRLMQNGFVDIYEAEAKSPPMSKAKATDEKEGE